MKQWYVAQVLTGFEDYVKADLEKRIVDEGLKDLFGDILVPTGEILSFFSDLNNKKEKIFPGYILINMEMVPEAFRLIATNPRISRFLGGSDPVPLSDKEVDRIFSQMEGKFKVADEKLLFSVGNEIHVDNGPFAGFVGTIDKIDEERERLTVMISIFGRQTPVELTFDQVKK